MEQVENEAIQKLGEYFAPRVMITRGIFYFKRDAEKPIWYGGEKEYTMAVLYKEILLARIYTRDENKKPPTIELLNERGGRVTGLTSGTWKFLIASQTNPAFYFTLLKETTGRLCFLDGILDFRTKQFYLWGDKNIPENYCSPVCIERNFKDAFENQVKLQGPIN